MLWLSVPGSDLAPYRACLPDKEGFSLDDILLLWFDLGPYDLHVGPTNLWGSYTLIRAVAPILFPCLCTVWATEGLLKGMVS